MSLLPFSLGSFTFLCSLQLSGIGEKGRARNRLPPKPCCVPGSDGHMIERVRLVFLFPQMPLQDHLSPHFLQLHTAGDTHHLLPLYTPNPVMDREFVSITFQVPQSPEQCLPHGRGGKRCSSKLIGNFKSHIIGTGS